MGRTSKALGRGEHAHVTIVGKPEEKNARYGWEVILKWLLKN
jgi:hypothetical protein